MILLLKTSSSIVCLYVIMAKIYALLYYVFYHKCDLPVLIADLTIVCACVLLLLVIWRKTTNVRCKTIWCILISGALFIQIFNGLFNYLTKSSSVNQKLVLWSFEIPNLLSVLILLTLTTIIFIEWGKQSQ